MEASRLSTTLKRFLVALLLVQVVFAPAPPAQASGIPVLDVAVLQENILIYVEDAITAAQQVLSTGQQFYEWAESFSLADLKGTLTGALQDKIMGYVKGGSGGPKFVTDWQTYLSGARDQGKRGAIDAISNTDVCDDFRTPLLNAIGATNQPSSPTDQNALSCDFPDGKLAEIAADPSKGSWADYQNSFKPQNNFYGSYLLAKSTVQREAAEKEKAAENEALAGQGFLSARDGSSGLITTPGSVLQDLTSKAAGSDFDLIANADQLKDIIGMVSGGLVSELTKGNDSGISGVDLASRRARRNRSRDASGDRIAQEKLRPNCVQVFLDSNNLSTTDFALFDTNNSGGLSEAEIENGIRNQVADVDYTLYDLCTDSTDSQTGNKPQKAGATIAEILAKRRKSKDKLDELAASFNKTIRNLSKYPTVSNKKYYKIDNPYYNPDSTVSADRYQYIYIKNVNSRLCFDVSTSTYKVVAKTSQMNRHAEIGFKYVDYVSDPADTFDPADPDSFSATATRTTNPAKDGGTTRCTVELYGLGTDGTPEKGPLIEVAYYEKQKQAIQEIIDANDLALKKVEALNSMIKTASKTGSAALRSKKVAELVADFDCHGDPFQCIINDPGNSALRKQLGCDDDDADMNVGEAGYFQADPACNKSSTWIKVPNHSIISAAEMVGRSFFARDTYGDILQKIGLTSPTAISMASAVAQNGLITNFNSDKEDDPSNPYYDSAFDPEEATRVFTYSQGNLAILGDLQVDDPDSDASGGDPNSDNNDSLPDS